MDSNDVVHEITLDRFEGYKKGNSRNCVVVGYPILDAYRNKLSDNIDKWWKDPERIKVIYAPHHSVNDVFKFSTFHKNYKFIRKLAETSGTSWVFKPHPMLRKAVLLAGIMDEKELEEYYQSWKEVGRICDNGDYFELFRSSDLMITDCYSFLAEYLPSGKPLIRLINEKSNPLDKLGQKLSGCYYNVHDNEELLSVFKKLAFDREDPLKEKRRIGAASVMVDDSRTATQKLIDDLNKVLRSENTMRIQKDNRGRAKHLL